MVTNLLTIPELAKMCSESLPSGSKRAPAEEQLQFEETFVLEDLRR